MTSDLITLLRNASKLYHPGFRQGEFTDWRDEQLSWKRTCYIGDWSFLPSLVVEGPDALQVFSDLAVNSFARFDIGQAKHAVFCNPSGKVITEGVLMRLDTDRYVVHGRPGWWVVFNMSKKQYNARHEREDSFIYQVQGPTSLALLEKLTGESLRDIGFMRFRTIPINGHPVRFLRQGMSGEVGFELQGPAEAADAVYAAIMEVGQEFGIRQLGRRTVMINHLEASFPTGAWHYLPAVFSEDMAEYRDFMQQQLAADYRLTVSLGGSFVGNDISDYYFSPYELGWGKVVKFDHEFIGRQALVAEAANPKRGLVTLEWNSEDVIDIYASMFRDGDVYDFLDIPTQERWVAWFDRVENDGNLVGLSTVPGYSFYFRKVLSLTVIDRELSTPGTSVEIVWGNPGSPQKLVRATVAPAPYKRDNRRVNLEQFAAVSG